MASESTVTSSGYANQEHVLHIDHLCCMKTETQLISNRTFQEWILSQAHTDDWLLVFNWSQSFPDWLLYLKQPLHLSMELSKAILSYKYSNAIEIESQSATKSEFIQISYTWIMNHCRFNAIQSGSNSSTGETIESTICLRGKWVGF